MVFLSNYLVFKIVLAALGRVDYPVAGDLELKYDNANKIYLSGGSLDYVDDVTLYTTIGGETTGYDIQFNSLNLDASNEQILFASDAATNHYFGSDTAISGNYAIVGAMDEDVSGGTDSGAAYIFYNSGTTWSQQAKLKASDPATSDKFGHRVDIEGDYAIVGAYNKNSGTGAAYIFKRSGTTWTQQSKLTASNAGASDEFGRAVGISGDYAFVGARREDTGGTDRGSVYIYVRSGTTWTQHAQIQSSDAQDSDNFGWALSVDGDYAVIGAYLEDTGGTDAGSAYIFYKSGTTWSQQAKIQSSDIQAGDSFGASVSISGDYLVVGAQDEDTGGSSAGSAYVFVRSGTSWTQQAILRASDAQASDSFSAYDPAVSISGNHVVVGAFGEDAGGSNAGAAYVFSRSGSTWTEVKKIVASNPTASDFFGQTVAIDGANVIMGAREEDTKASAAGAAYIYSSQQVTNYYITDAGKYSVDATIAGLNYKTNELDITSLTIPAKVVQVSAGGNVSLALTQDGFVYAWGEDTYGQMGQGTTDTNVNTPVKVKGVGGSGFLSNITKITVGGTFCIALASDGTLYTWGQNNHNQLGDGTNTERKTPVTVSYSGDPISNISAGMYHSAFTTTTGKVYAFGRNNQGQVGDNTSGTNRSTPTQVVGVGNSGTLAGIRDVSCGDDFTHAIKDSDGSVYGWGKQLYGMIGNGQNSGDALTPTSVILASDSSAVTGITQISGGGDSSLMLKSDGTVYACGYNGLGQIGNGSTSDADSGLVQVLGVGGSGNLTGITQIAIAYASSLALKSDGTMYSWGNNYDGQNGLGTVGGTNPTTPVAITLLTGVDTINTDGKPSHFIVTKLDGSVFCWGRGDEGQIGDGTNTADQGTPTQVLAGAGPSVDGKFNLFTEPRLTFDGYNKLSLLHGLSSVSSKLFLGSNVYDIGTLTSDLTIETPGLYRGLVFDTSSNVAYFNKTTVGAIASTMAGYEVEQILYGIRQSGSPSQGGFGSYIDFNGDGTRFVLGLGMDTTTGANNGRAKVYHLESGTWTLKVDIPTPNTGSTRFGDSVCMNEDGTRIVVNHYPNIKAYIYDYASGAWPTTPTATIIGGITGAFGEGDMDMNRSGTVIVFGSRAYGTQIWSRAGDGTWSETKNWGNGQGGYGVAINGAGTRIVTGKESTGQIFEANYDGSSWGSLTSVIDTSYTSWPAKIRMDSDGTTLIVNANPATEAGIYERQSGTSWTLSQSILSTASYYSRGGLSISYDGTMVLVGDISYNTSKGRAYLWQKSGGSWSLTNTIVNPTTPNEQYWGAGVAIAKNSKSRYAIGMPYDNTAGTSYGSIRVYTNAIPDFISFDTYNKLSLSGITNPTSKIHALPTGAESTTTYDIGSATNIYIESAGTYTAEMKGSDGFALDSNVVGAITIAPPVNDLTYEVEQYMDQSDNTWKSRPYGPPPNLYSTNTNIYETTLPNGDTGYVMRIAPGQFGYGGDSKNWSNLRTQELTFKLGPTKTDWESYAWPVGLSNDNMLIDFSYDSGPHITINGNNNSLAYCNSGSLQQEGQTNGVSTTEWNHLVCVKISNNDVEVYLNGQLDFTFTPASTAFPANNRALFGPRDLTGRDAADFLTYNARYYPAGKILSASEVKQRYDHIFETSPPSLTFDGFNKYTFTNADTGSTYKLKYESNTYDLGTISNVYIAYPGTYSAEIKGATNFALSSNTASLTTPSPNSQLYYPLTSEPSANVWSSTTDVSYGSDGVTFNSTSSTFGIEFTVPTSGIFTVSCNFMKTSFTSGVGVIIASSTNQNSPELESNFTATSHAWRSTNTGYVNTTGLTHYTNQWYHMVWVHDKNNGLTAYLDGVKVYSYSGTIGTPQTSFIVGPNYRSGTITNQFGAGGKMSDIRIYDTAISSTEAELIYKADNKYIPKLDFDGYNKLTLSGLDSGSTSNVLFNGNTYSIGTASNVYIENTGTYEAESKGTTTFALTSNVVGAGQISTPSVYSSATPTLVDPINITSGIWSSGNYEHYQTHSTYYLYALSLDDDDSDRFIKYDWVNLVWSDQDESGTYSTFGTSATDTAATARSITNPTHIYLMAGAQLHGTMVNPYYQVPNYSPSLTHDGYKLVVKNITPTSTSLRLGSNTYDIGTATNIYVENTGDYTAEIGNATDFAFTSNTVSGTIKTIEPGFASRYQGSMALTYDGKLYAWGMNDDGEAGVGTSSDITVPTLCTGITQGTVAKLLSGSDITENSRGEVSAIKTTDGKIYMAGKGDNNCIPGKTSDQTSFTDVTSYFGDQSLTANTVTMMSFTDASGAALTETGNVWTWGTHDSTYKKLGQASASTSSTPKQINFSSATGTITKITCGHYHTVALDSSGDVWFWGKNEINSDSWPSSITDEPQKVVDGKNIIGLSQSYGTMYAWDATGKMWNAGNNWEGQIGDGTTTANSSGKTLTEVTYFSSNNITINKVYAGGYFVFADTSDGYYCWGNGGNGVFGNGSTGNITGGPAKWTNVTNIKKFMASTQHTTAITEDGKYYAWGRDYHGGRGDSDSASDISYPKYIDTLPNILAPSFDYDGYDKVFVNQPYTQGQIVKFSKTTQTWPKQILITDVRIKDKDGNILPIEYIYFPLGNGGPNQDLEYIRPSDSLFSTVTDGSYSSVDSGALRNNPQTDWLVYAGDSVYNTYAIGTEWMHVKAMSGSIAQVQIVWDRQMYIQPTRLDADGMTYDIPQGNQSTLAGQDSTYTLTGSYTSEKSSKYTKDTHTYDANQSQIVTVSDPGTYDAQIKSGTDFSLKSATVPATSSTGLYTWAFHHGNFDNAYGDGDILTARDNGRFYADTPAYTGDIGTITPLSGFSTPTIVADLASSPANGVPSNSWNGRTFIQDTTVKSTSSGALGGSGTLSDPWVYRIAYTNGTLDNADHVVIWPKAGFDGSGCGWADATLDTSVTPNIVTERSGGFGTPNPSGQNVSSTGEVQWTYNNTSTVGYTFQDPYFNIAHTSPLKTTYTFAPPSGGLTANVLMVAGGGGGGGRYSCGGGGAGGLVYTAGTSLVNGATKTIVVGNGDSGGNGDSQNGFTGKNTTFTDLTPAVGGGYGGTQGTAGGTGGSGGGGGGQTGNGTGGSATSGQGNAGGTGSNSGTYGGAGGGGAGAAGGNGSNGVGGNGGIGKFFGTGSSFTNFGDEYGEGGYFAGGAGGGTSGAYAYGIPGRGGGGYGAAYDGYMSRGGSQHGMVHTGGGGGGGSTPDRDQHPGYASTGDGGVTAHGGRGGSGIVLIQTNVAPPNGSNTAVVQVGNPRRRSLPPTVDAMGSEVNRFSIIDSASMPTYKLPTHWYVDPISSNSDRKNDDSSSKGQYTIQTRADGGTSNVWYATASDPIYLHCNMMQTLDGIFMPVEKDVRYDRLLRGGGNDTNDIALDMEPDGTAALYRNNSGTLLQAGTIKCFTVGKWHHIALTIDSGGNAVGYVNGYPVVTGTHTSTKALGSRNVSSFFYCGGNGTPSFRKYLAYECSTYNFLMSPKQVLQRAAEVGCGPKLEYDGLNTIKILNTEPGSSVKLFTSNVEDTSNVFIVADPAAGEYTVPESGKYYAEIKGTDTFTVTKTLDVSGTFPLYQYPPVATGTKSSLTTSLSADTWNTWTMSGASAGNGQYQVKTSHTTNAPGGTNATAASLFTNGVKIEIISDGGASIYSFLHTSTLSNFDITLQLPSAKTIRKYVLYPADSAPVSTPGGSVDPTLPGGGGEHNTRRPKSWALKGSNDATSWTTIHTVTNKPPSIYGDVHTISSPASYQYYQLSISENNGSSQFIQLGEWQLWGDA